MKKWSRVTAFVLALAMLLSSASSALALVEVDFDTLLGWIQNVKESQGLGDVIKLIRGGVQQWFPEGFTPVDWPLYPDGENSYTLEYAADNAADEPVVLSRYGKTKLIAPQAGQWQLYLNDADVWVNIAGETSNTFELTYAKVESAFEQNGSVQLRSVMGDAVTQTANVGITYAASILPAVAEDNGAAYSVRSENSGIMLAEEGEEPDLSEVYVVVKFMQGENEVFSEYKAQLDKNGSLKTDIPVEPLEGYVATYFENDKELPGTAVLTESTQTQAGKLALDFKTITEDITLVVYYQADIVTFTVKHFLQNLDGSYPEDVTGQDYVQPYNNTKTGQTVTAMQSDLTKEFPGFDPLWYDKNAVVAADGSTVVNIRYEREYHLIKFELGENGYGTEPIYACYGASLGTIKTPTRPGYTFAGWKLDNATVQLPTTMPAEDRTYTAIWTPNDKAKVTVVFWGENADDEGYSYVKTGTLSVTPGDTFTYTENNTQFIICGKEAHTHSDTCTPTLKCTTPEHTHGSADCNCTKEVHPAHNKGCYGNDVGDPGTPNGSPPTNAVDGQIYRRYSTIGQKYIFISGQWYEYNGNASRNTVVDPTCGGLHTHGDGTCTCNQAEHSHSESCYTYSCGLTTHSHVASCYQNGSGMESAKWKLVKSETVTVAADGTSIINVYFDRTEFTLTFKNGSTTVKTIKTKWGADIHSEFPIETSNGATILWSVPNGCENFKPGTYLASINRMPPENIIFTRYGEGSAATIYYYVEVLPGEEYTYTNTYNGVTKYFKLYKSVKYTKNGYLTYAEEFHDILGYKQWNSSPAFGSNGQTSSVNTNNYLYYARNAYDIVYYNPTELIKTDDNVPYEKPLTNYYWEPTSEQAPIIYEPGSVEFEGWYLNPECTGQKFDFTTQKMPAGPNNQDGEVTLSLYAKWVPVTRTVQFYLDKDALLAGTELSTHQKVEVLHGTSIEVEDPVNGQYAFEGWFYMENGVEKAYDFENMPIMKDLQVYGKWTADKPLDFVVYYKLLDENGNQTNIEVAEPVTGKALDGDSVKVEAKTGNDLYKAYQTGCFPVKVSHSLDLDIDDESSRTYTFWYIQADTMPYTVNHIKVTYNNGVRVEEVVETQTHTTANAIVTERYMNIPGYAPDAYQKRLVISTDATKNVINFYYEIDNVNAIYSIVHKKQPLDVALSDYANYVQHGVEFNERKPINSTVSAERLQLDGFSFEKAIITKTTLAEDGSTSEEKVDPATVLETVLTNGGVTFELYYKRNTYPYTVRYLLNEPDANGNYPQLLDPKTGSGLYQERITETAPAISGYYIGNNTASITITIDDATGEPENLITFYYNENFVPITYEVVGPTGCGVVELNDQSASGTQVVEPTVKVISGDAVGATAKASSNLYRFVGWYVDKDCTIPVTAADGKLSNMMTSFDPAKEAAYTDDEGNEIPAMYAKATFYAKFEYNLTTLTITKSGAQAIDAGQSFLFKVTGYGLPANGLLIAINGNGSETISGLTVGETYTVTEVETWSWRYTAQPKTIKLVADPEDKKINTVKIENTRDQIYWLDGDCYAENVFGQPSGN